MYITAFCVGTLSIKELQPEIPSQGIHLVPKNKRDMYGYNNLLQMFLLLSKYKERQGSASGMIKFLQSTILVKKHENIGKTEY